MAYTLTRNLKLRLDSNLTANARYNLDKLDLLGSTFVTDTTNSVRIRSQTDILLEPESADLGGSAVGGTVSIGTISHKISAFNVFADIINLGSAGIGLLDSAAGGSKYLKLQYKSDLSGSVDTTSDRILTWDLNGANRNVILEGNYTQLGGDVRLTVPSLSDLTLPASGTLATLAGSETLSNKSINAVTNTITGLTNSSISTGAGIVYSKLDLASSIQTSDLSPSIAIPYSKLVLTGAILSTDLAPEVISYIISQVEVSGSVVQAVGTWVTGDGPSKTFTHGLGKASVDVSLIDLSDNTKIYVDTIHILDNNNVTLAASEAPQSTWKIIVTG